MSAAAGASVPPLAAAAPAPRRGSLRELVSYRQLITLLVARELKVRYKRSLFGLAWTMLNPLLLMAVYSVVFTTVMSSPVHDFAIFLLGGLLPWLFISTSLLQGMTSVLGSQELIRKVRLPQAVFPLAVVGSNLVNFVLSLGPLFLVMLVVDHPITWALLYLPVSALLITLFASGVTLFFSSATVFFRDVRHLVEVLLQLLFYLSPVIYDLDQITAANQKFWWSDLLRTELSVNPITYLLPLVRDPVYAGHLPSLQTQLSAAAWAVGVFAAGLYTFRRLEPRHIHHF